MNTEIIKKSPLSHATWVSLLKFIGFFLVGWFVAQFLSLIVIGLYLAATGQFDVDKLTFFLQNLTQAPEGRSLMLVLLIVSAGFIFVVTPLLYLKWTEQKSLKDLNTTSKLSLPLILLVIFITISFMPVNAIFIEWNMHLRFPEFLKGFEKWASIKEEELKELTTFITHFDSVGQVILGIVAIALLPAVGEELTFRGVLQNKFWGILKNPHVAILVTSIVFSAFHLQFYGFVPRILLGVLFGYLYYWSGNIYYPMIAHFVNNGFTLMAVYLQQQNIIQMDIENPQQIPWGMSLASAVFVGFCLFAFYRLTKNNKKYDTNY